MQYKAREDTVKNKDRYDKALVAFVKSDKPPIVVTLTTSHKDFIDSSTTAHMMKGASLVTEEAVPSDISVETASKDRISSKA